jgi:hypothetical protein
MSSNLIGGFMNWIRVAQYVGIAVEILDELIILIGAVLYAVFIRE